MTEVHRVRERKVRVSAHSYYVHPSRPWAIEVRRRSAMGMLYRSKASNLTQTPAVLDETDSSIRTSSCTDAQTRGDSQNLATPKHRRAQPNLNSENMRRTPKLFHRRTLLSKTPALQYQHTHSNGSSCPNRLCCNELDSNWLPGLFNIKT